MERVMAVLDRARRAGLAVVLVGMVVALGLFLALGHPRGAPPGPAGGSPLADDPESVARAVVARLAAGDYAGLESGFDAAMVSALPEDRLRQTWQTVVAQQGQVLQVASVETAVRDPYVICLVRVEMDHGPLNVQVTVDVANRVSGLYFRPASAAWSPPPYANSASFREIEMTVGAPGWPLPGTLTLPNGEGPFPAVILVHGSGPNDRDETIGPNKPFRDLAWGLGSKGIAVLRYDKRTLVYASRLTATRSSLTVREETIDDAVAAVESLRADSRIKPDAIVIAGHSLGGYLAPRIAAAVTPGHLAGVVLLAAPTLPLEDLILRQYEYLAADAGGSSPAGVVDVIRTQVALVKSNALSTSTPAADLPLGIPASYWLDLRGYDPASLAASQSLPMLILQGGRDYQVPPSELDAWRSALAGRANVTLRSYPLLNHLFVAGTGKSTPREYEAAGHVDEAVVSAIAGWTSGVSGMCAHCAG